MIHWCCLRLHCHGYHKDKTAIILRREINFEFLSTSTINKTMGNCVQLFFSTKWHGFWFLDWRRTFQETVFLPWINIESFVKRSRTLRCSWTICTCNLVLGSMLHIVVFFPTVLQERGGNFDHDVPTQYSNIYNLDMALHFWLNWKNYTGIPLQLMTLKFCCCTIGSHAQIYAIQTPFWCNQIHRLHKLLPIFSFVYTFGRLIDQPFHIMGWDLDHFKLCKFSYNAAAISLWKICMRWQLPVILGSQGAAISHFLDIIMVSA